MNVVEPILGRDLLVVVDCEWTAVPADVRENALVVVAFNNPGPVHGPRLFRAGVDAVFVWNGETVVVGPGVPDRWCVVWVTASNEESGFARFVCRRNPGGADAGLEPGGWRAFTTTDLSIPELQPR